MAHCHGNKRHDVCPTWRTGQEKARNSLRSAAARTATAGMACTATDKSHGGAHAATKAALAGAVLEAARSPNHATVAQPNQGQMRESCGGAEEGQKPQMQYMVFSENFGIKVYIIIIMGQKEIWFIPPLNPAQRQNDRAPKTAARRHLEPTGTVMNRRNSSTQQRQRSRRPADGTTVVRRRP